MTTLNTTTATTAELVAFFNANTGGAAVKKFADRKTAERRVQALIDEMAEETTAAEEIEVCAVAIDNSSSVHAFAVHGQTHCPACGAHLSNGVGEHNQDVNGRPVKHAAFEYECLACGTEFGPAIKNHYVRPNGAPIASRPAMVESLKIDRQIVSVASGIVYKNANQVYKAGLVSSSQCDRLSAALYGAAKAGNRLMSVEINGNVFALAVK